jgi:4-aminobutyrate aminotransferase-like enzyme
VNDVNPTSVRIAPPLVIAPDEVKEGIERFDASVKAVR